MSLGGHRTPASPEIFGPPTYAQNGLTYIDQI